MGIEPQTFETSSPETSTIVNQHIYDFNLLLLCSRRQFNRPVNDVIRRIVLVRHGQYHREGTREGHLTTLGTVHHAFVTLTVKLHFEPQAV